MNFINMNYSIYVVSNIPKKHFRKVFIQFDHVDYRKMSIFQRT